MKKMNVEIQLYHQSTSVNSKMASSQASSTHGSSIIKAKLEGIGNLVAYP